MDSYTFYSKKIKKRFFTQIGREKARIKKQPRYKKGTISLFNKNFYYHDNLSFIDTYNEIFENEIYKFNPHDSKKTILDCGANMGLSVLYFSLNYPDHQIIAFEPDDEIFLILEENIKTYNLNNVQLIQKAVWDKEETLEFFTDSGMGGRIGSSFSNHIKKSIQATRLKNYLADDIGFLKIDIEGAESNVLIDCKNDLQSVNYIFFEYHGHYKEPQKLHELLTILYNNGFHYYIKESSTRQKPFIDDGLICEVFDMAINIFAYHNNETEKNHSI